MKAILSFLLFIVAAQSMAATYYVATNGSDSASGSVSEPWLTIQKSANTMVAGDTVIVTAGTYLETVTETTSGASGTPITYQVADGASVVVTRFKIFGEWVVVDGFNIVDGAFNSICTIGRSNVTILNCTLSGGSDTARGIVTILENDTTAIPFLTNIVIRGNTFTGQQYINLHLTTDDSLVESNLWISTGYDAINLWGTRNIIRGNIASNLYSVGEKHPDFIQTDMQNKSLTWYSYTNTVENNLVIDSNAQPFNLSEDATTTNTGHWIFRNNIFANLTGNGNCGIPRCEFYNNTFYVSASAAVGGNYPVAFLGPLSYPNQFNGSFGIASNNLFIACGGSDTDSTGFYLIGSGCESNTFANYNYAAGHLPGYASKTGFTETNGVNGGNPLFADPSAYDFHIATNSPAVGAGANLSALFTTDFYGNARPASGAWTIGAVQTTGTDVTAPTLSTATIATNGTALTLAYSEAVTQGAGYADTQITVDASTTGAGLAVTYASGNGTATRVYTIASAIQSGETVTLDFTGTANSLEDAAGNDLAAISARAVTNGSTQGEGGGGGWPTGPDSPPNRLWIGVP